MIPTDSERVVIQCNNEVIKGFVDQHKAEDLETLLGQSTRKMPEAITVRTESGELREIPTDQAKAVFFVKSFEGQMERDELKFFSHAPLVHGIWIQAEFRDGEVIEGIVHNSMHHLVERGFFLVPTDPGSNNKLIYVLKKALKDYRVLGIRAL